MCGIAGFVGEGGREDLIAMTRALAHRGPDGEGFHIDDREALYLGHRRLSIIDIEGGHQPMWNEDDTIAVVYNGEIYNHLELRQALIAKGHVFRTDHSDTEVLVHGYEEWGDDLPARLNGMFAFAIFDRRRRRLFLARDRFGEKPLYYLATPRSFAFASELHALALHPACSRAPDRRALQKLFAYGYIPSPHAFLQGTRKLPPGNHLTLDFAEGHPSAPRTARYWQFRLNPDDSLADDDELAEELRALLAQAARRRLISDVPLGVFLSGGLDSSGIVASLQKDAPSSALEAFTIGFNESSFDESPFARLVAEATRCRHRLDTLDLGKALSLIPSVLDRLDEPTGDPSILPTFLLCRFARQFVTVALSGDGGDELFAGYDTFDALTPARLYQALVPTGLHRGLRKLAELLPHSPHNMSFDFKVRRALQGVSYPPAMWNPTWMAPVEPALMADLFDEPLSAEALYDEAIALWNDAPTLGPVDRTIEFFANFYLPDDILAKVDRAAMMVSLETRAVFLDNDVAAFCRRLPSRFKYRGGRRKILLRKALAPLLPAAVIDRRKKGFGVPLAAWLKHIAPEAERPVAGLRSAAISRAWAEHRRGTADHRLMLWTWLSLQHTASAYAARPGRAGAA